MAHLQRPIVWMPLLLALGTGLLAPLLRQQGTLQSQALALLICGCVALSGYLISVIVHPENFG